MNRLANRFIVVMVGMLLACSVFGEYKGNGGKNKEESNGPLDNLTKRQKDHYKSYVALAELQQKKASYDRAAVIEETFGDVREWCQVAGPKYRAESVKAGDKANNSENEKHKKQLQERSSAYAALYDACLKIVKSFDTREIAYIEQALEKYKKAENAARIKEFQTLKREWLCYSEFATLFMKEYAAKNRKAEPEKTAVKEKKATQENSASQKKTRTRGNTEKKEKKKR